MRQFRDTLYYVSPDGIVMSRYPVGGDNRFKKGRPSSNNCRQVGSLTATGYKCVKTRKMGSWLIHQMVMECYGLPCPGDGYVVDHIDGNKLNNHIDNLQWLTIGQNVAKSHPGTKHSRELEDKIRSEFVPRVYTRKMLSEKYGIPEGTIKDILRRKVNP